MDFFAHIRMNEAKDSERQSLAAHSRQAALYASMCMKDIGLENAGYLSGLLHDMGKFKEEYQQYLESGDKSKRGSVNHTFAGCRYLLDHFHGDKAVRVEDVTAEILAYAVGAHHGLFDCVDADKRSGFLHRQQKTGIKFAESHDNYLADCADQKKLQSLFVEANQELSIVYQKIRSMVQDGRSSSAEEYQFHLALLTRMILSSVIEGDRRDTAEYMNATSFQSNLVPRTEIWASRLAFLEEKIQDFSQDTDIQIMRMTISDRCRSMAEQPGGIYRLNVPTGSGKTLSALRFALAHAKKWEKQRIIYVTPLLAILEQNAAVVREFVGDDSIIMEHHSNVVREKNDGHSIELRELAMENWDVPIIITTMVQLLNTMFLGKTSSIRRFHALANSVIVIDEVQTVPNNMLTLFNLMVNFLSEVCGTTFLLCSATQPCFEKTTHPMLDRVKDLVPYQESLWAPFQRTSLEFAGTMRLEEIPKFISALLTQHRSVLVVCNKKSQSAYLYQALEKESASCYHLSAAMCMAHRQKTLDDLYDSLADASRKTLCVATQVIEAGVDISFECVVRLMAGMDSIVQSAGRCNRNGELSYPAPVYIVDCEDETLTMLPDIQREKDATTAVLASQDRDQTILVANDKRTNDFYYEKLYAKMYTAGEDFQDFPIKNNLTIFSLLSSNKDYMDGSDADGVYSLNQAFKTAGQAFHVFQSDTVDVIAPYEKGKKLIEELENEPFMTVGELRGWVERAKGYTVALYDYQCRALGATLREINGVLILPETAYDDQMGLSIGKDLELLEV